MFETAFASYTEDRVVGEGGAGRVYAVHDGDGRQYALKLLSGSTSEQRKRFKNEIGFCVRNRHRNVIQVLDHGLFGAGPKAEPFYVMPLYPRTLRTRMVAGILPSEALTTFSFLLDGVEAAHLQGVWHRDLKPENVLCGAKPEEVVVADFGIAHFAEEALLTAIQTRPGSRLANFQYAAPEQRTIRGHVDHRADIYSLGLMLNEMFTGEVPHGNDHKVIGSAAPDYPYLDALVAEMRRQDPANRPQSIDAVKKELIARGNRFFAQQQLDRVSREVVKSSSVPDVASVTLTSVDYRKGKLVLCLNRSPEREWVRVFNQGNYPHAFIHGSGPDAFTFDGSEASIPAQEYEVQKVVDHFKTYLDLATDAYRWELKKAAAEFERRQSEELSLRRKEAETRERVLSTIKI